MTTQNCSIPSSTGSPPFAECPKHQSEGEFPFVHLFPASLSFEEGKLLTLAVDNPELTLNASQKFWGDRYGKDRTVFVLLTRGGPLSRWSQKNPPNTVERSLVLIGQTADSGRVRDVASVLAMIQQNSEKDKDAPKRIRLAGRGAAGIICAYAAAFVPGVVEELEIIDPPMSHRDGPHFLNVLRVCDIPEALGLLAPNVKLTLVGKNAKDRAFDTTEAIYKAAGAADKFKRE